MPDEIIPEQNTQSEQSAQPDQTSEPKPEPVHQQPTIPERITEDLFIMEVRNNTSKIIIKEDKPQQDK